MLTHRQTWRSKRTEETCISCGARLARDSAISYPCPSCGEIITRCKRCKKLSNPYRCACGFRGP
ncbi:MAG: zinc finger domain-containing protein [Halobacteriota archaeon]